MRMVSLASGSSGNCIYIGSDNHHVLIDAGIPKKRIEEGLAGLELKPEDLDGILVTHEHSDHVSGLGVMARKYGIPIYGTAGTLGKVAGMSSLGKVDTELFWMIEAEKKFRLGDLTIHPFAVSHDAAEPVAYRVEQGEHSVAVATDLGEYTEETVEHLKSLDALILEANHDLRMLQVGPYPYYLKQRVMGRQGHLSNESAGRLLSEVLHPGLRQVLLGHLSKENNYAELAYETVRLEVALGEKRQYAKELELAVAPRNISSRVIKV